MATIKDVARISGVSISTVSIVLNGKAEERRISKKTQEEVLSVVKQLNYKPNISAKKLRSNNRHSYTVALYWAVSFRPNLLGRFLEGVQQELLKKNSQYEYDIVICPYEIDKLYLEKGLKTASMFSAAIIVASSESDMKYLESLESLIPIVLVNRYSEKYHTVGIDNFLAGAKAGNLFLSKGYKEVGAIYYTDAYLAISERNEGFTNFCKENNIQIPKEYTFFTDNSLEGGVDAAKKFLQLEKRPSAIYCDSDSIAMGAVYYFNKNGLKIPEDLEIICIGMERKEVTQYCTPSLSVVDVPLEKMASKCINLIEDVLEIGKEKLLHITYDSDLILRDSFQL